MQKLLTSLVERETSEELRFLYHLFMVDENGSQNVYRTAMHDKLVRREEHRSHSKRLWVGCVAGLSQILHTSRVEINVNLSVQDGAL